MVKYHSGYPRLIIFNKPVTGHSLSVSKHNVDSIYVNCHTLGNLHSGSEECKDYLADWMVLLA